MQRPAHEIKQTIFNDCQASTQFLLPSHSKLIELNSKLQKLFEYAGQVYNYDPMKDK